MVRDRIIDLVKAATEVNLRYSAIALKLAKEYVKEFDVIVRNGATANAGTRGSEDVPADKAAPERRPPPILLVGEAGSEASGAFVLNNMAETELSVTLALQGDPGPVRAKLVPAALTIAPAASAVVQIRVAITEKLELRARLWRRGGRARSGRRRRSRSSCGVCRRKRRPSRPPGPRRRAAPPRARPPRPWGTRSGR